MQSLENAAKLLEQLKELVVQYDPIKFESTNEKKLLAEQIPQIYGAVKVVYRSITGDQRVELIDRGTTSYYHNYFEAGYMSGITIHSHKGRQELLQVIGHVKAEISQGVKYPANVQFKATPNSVEAPTTQASDNLDKSKIAFKERFESHPIIFGVSLIIIGFAAGYSFNEWTKQFINNNQVVEEGKNKVITIHDNKRITSQIELLTQEHNKRLDILYEDLRFNEKEAVYNGNLDSAQIKHVKAAERLRVSIKEENNSYTLHLEKLRGFAN